MVSLLIYILYLAILFSVNKRQWACILAESFYVQDVINRVQNLESMGHITGVMDDRGKVGKTRSLSTIISCEVPYCFASRDVLSAAGKFLALR